MSCDSDDQPWDKNVLLSPETNLESDSLLTFNLSSQRSGSLEIYATSVVGHFSFRVAAYAPSSVVTYNETLYNMTYGVFDDDQTNETITFTSESVCVSKHSHKLAFVGSAMYSLIEDTTQQDAVIKDVTLTTTPCTAQALPG